MSPLRTGLISGMEVILRYKELCSNFLLYSPVIFTISHRCCSFSSYLWPLCSVIVSLGSQLHEISSNTARNSLKHSFNFAKKKHMHLHNSKPLFKISGINPKSIVLHSLLMWVSPIFGCKEPAAKLAPHKNFKKFTCSRREKGWDSWWTLTCFQVLHWLWHVPILRSSHWTWLERGIRAIQVYRELPRISWQTKTTMANLSCA